MPFNFNQPAYVRLENALGISTRPTLVWTGSGLSAAARLPTWAALKKALIEDGRKGAKAMARLDQETQLARLSQIEQEANLWLSFERLQKTLGDATYTASIRDQLAAADRVASPKTYRSIWQ